jgi:hypothetical protein
LDADVAASQVLLGLPFLCHDDESGHQCGSHAPHVAGQASIAYVPSSSTQDSQRESVVASLHVLLGLPFRNHDDESSQPP